MVPEVLVEGLYSITSYVYSLLKMLKAVATMAEFYQKISFGKRSDFRNAIFEISCK